jgi:hypothetical protein
LPTAIVLLLLAPFVVIVIVFGVVVIVALCQAKSEDVPTVLRESSSVFRRMTERLPSVRMPRLGGTAAPQAIENTSGEEAR